MNSLQLRLQVEYLRPETNAGLFERKQRQIHKNVSKQTAGDTKSLLGQGAQDSAPAPSCTRRVLPESSADDERAPIAARWDGPRKRALPGPTPGASQARPAAFLAGNQSVAAVLPMQPRSSTYLPCSAVERWPSGRRRSPAKRVNGL